ncbi:protein MON2 homolog isoform X2 [Anneissia japonica]|uniref:protein MON2 homolog isoform X2 n=1 Tax=Anneissia japonica TaxID=1529436 RepID=UPI0014256DCD|nr:protein MON2 homolog isoform X2 [Anneissia japonica]
MATVDVVSAKKLVENLQTDLRALSNEAKKKYPPVKEAAEAGILRIRTVVAKNKNIIPALVACSGEIMQPFLLGCDTKNLRIVQICLASIQRLIAKQALSPAAGANVINMLWNLMDSGIEDLKVLQTTLVLVTTSTVVRGNALARAIVICFRLHFSKDNTISNTASAIVQQVVCTVFERVLAEDEANAAGAEDDAEKNVLKSNSRLPPKSLRPCATDAYLLFQDLCQLVNAEHPTWLLGLTEMSRTFGLELLESLLNSFPQVFLRHKEFSFLLKERVCPLVIKLFSPSLKHKQNMMSTGPLVADKPYFPLNMRLLRVVSVLINKYYSILVTESEIFLSLLVKFLEGDKPMWQRILALEVLHKLCVQLKLLRSFCQSYDMKAHSTKIFANIVNALGSFIQSLFVHPIVERQGSTTDGGITSSPGIVGSMSVGGGVTPQPAFAYKGVWIPLINVAATGSAKPVFLEMLDKLEPPTVPDGYGLSIAFTCLLDVVRSVSAIVTSELEAEQRRKDKEQGVSPKINGGPVLDRNDAVLDDVDPSLKNLWEELVNASWCGVLAALSLLLEACTDETGTQSILKSLEVYASLCGKLGMTVARDAFITCLCKASLPPHYALTVLNIATPQNISNKGHKRNVSRDGLSNQHGQGVDGNSNEPGDGRNQVVAVGTALPTVQGTQQGPVMLTAKNIQCMRAILSVAHCHGGILGTAWHLVLTTLQHLAWILGLKPSTGGSLKVSGASETANSVITTAVMGELPILSAMLSRLFESSQYLDEVALHHLIDALCKLSSESMEIAYANKEPSLFAVAKLLETGLVNLSRVEVLWRPVTAHLLEVCQHSHSRTRDWGAEAVTSLIKASLAYKFQPPLHENLKLQTMLLSPLQELSVIQHPDIRQKQLECVLQVLHNNGETLAHGWPLVLGVIGAVSDDQGDNLIRTAFKCFQLVTTDFLPIMPRYGLQICISVAAKFGLQKEELNISLTAVGLLWNISDYLYQNRVSICEGLEKESNLVEGTNDSSPNEAPVPPFDALWLTLYSKQADLCVDSRPAVRKSAGQTLFSTISAHGSLLQQTTWSTVLWHVLFPLLDKVKKLSGAAKQDKSDVSGGVNILIHHSRDTAEKQWAETKVLTLAGVARVFNTWRQQLILLGDFPRAWALLLEHIEASALSTSNEVSLNALKSFQEILQLQSSSPSPKVALERATSFESNISAPKPERIKRTTSNDMPKVKSSNEIEVVMDDFTLWSTAWRVWHSIGINGTKPPTSKTAKTLPSQAFLTTLLQIFPTLFQHIKAKFVASDFQKLSRVLQCAVSVPIHADASPFILPSSMLDAELTGLQEAALNAINCVSKAVGASETMQSMHPAVFDQLLTFVTYACQAPSFGQIETRVISKTATKQSAEYLHSWIQCKEKWESFRGCLQAEWVSMNYVPFAEKSLSMTTSLYKKTATRPAVMEQQVLQNILRVLQMPLGLKYACPSASTWKLAVTSLLEILHVGLPVARNPAYSKHFKSMWLDLAAALELFLFSEHPAPATLSVEEQQQDEAMDVNVVLLIQNEVLPYSTALPPQFTAKIMGLLNRGSIHSASSSSFLDTNNTELREEFAKTCFETLLRFSFITQSLVSEEGAITKMAMSALLQRCQEVLRKYVEDERLSGKCPLPRSRMAEISFVLKALTTLMESLKKAQSGNVDVNTWDQVIDLYPTLVDCTTCTSTTVCSALRDVLSQYHDLLLPPSSAMQNGR